MANKKNLKITLKAESAVFFLIEIFFYRKSLVLYLKIRKIRKTKERKIEIEKEM